MENVPNPDALFRAIEQDRRLEAASDQGLEALARHRWHWTLDESNPERVTVYAYAKRTGRTQANIARMAKGYAAWVNAFPAGNVSLSDCIATANASVEQAQVIREVAAATGWSPGHVEKNESRMVRDIRATAEDLATRKGTAVADEIPRAARTAAAVRKAEQRSRTERRATKSARLNAAEGRMFIVLKALRDLLQDAEGEDFTVEEIELIMLLINKSRGFLQLVELKITGETDVDWDGELAKLGESA